MTREDAEKIEATKMTLMWVLCIALLTITMALIFISSQLSEISNNLKEVRKDLRTKSNSPKAVLVETINE